MVALEKTWHPTRKNGLSDLGKGKGYLPVKAAGDTPLAKLNKGRSPTSLHHAKRWSWAYKQKINFWK